MPAVERSAHAAGIVALLTESVWQSRKGYEPIEIVRAISSGGEPRFLVRGLTRSRVRQIGAETLLEAYRPSADVEAAIRQTTGLTALDAVRIMFAVQAGIAPSHRYDHRPSGRGRQRGPDRRPPIGS